MLVLLASLLAMVALSGVGLAASRSTRAHGIVYVGMAVACGLAFLPALLHLLGTQLGPAEVELPVGLPWLKARLRLDALAAFFLVLVNLSGALASVYALGHGRHDQEPARVLVPYPLFVAGMNLVPLAQDAFSFLLAWEFMSVASWVLVLASHREPGTSAAARIYLVMAGFGTACLLLAFGILAGPEAAYAFDAIRTREIDPGTAGLAVLLVLLGAGSKAGLVPLHVWLPLAHPAAPAHVSALMSGVMTKLAVYALLRVLFDLAGEPSLWWGAILATVGVVTAVAGVLHALVETDLKRVLAYSTVENLGVIAVGLGVALVFKASGVPALAALALTAALLHALNHSLFKGLLFMGAGAVLSATGRRDLDRLGGLVRRMPVTALCFLVGSAAISALPPLNGFAGEWMLFQAILNGPLLAQWELRIGFAVLGAMLALSAALAAAAFVRVFGIAFLGRPRSPEADGAKEVTGTMTWAMAVPAGLCVLLGVLPSLAIALIEPVNAALAGEKLAEAGRGGGVLWLAPASAFGNSYSGFVMLALIAGLSVLLVSAIHRFGSARSRRAASWGCGFADPVPLGQHGASGLSQPLRRVFASGLFSAREAVDMPAPGETRPARFTIAFRDPAWELLFTPLGRAVEWVSGRANVLRGLSIRRYLALMFTALVGLLALVALVR